MEVKKGSGFTQAGSHSCTLHSLESIDVYRELGK
jgi:hypothetical protein